MSHEAASPAQSSRAKPRRRVLLVLALLLGAVVVGYAVLDFKRRAQVQAAQQRESEIVAAIRALGGETAVLVSEMFPLGWVFPGQAGTHYRYAIKLRKPDVTDDQLAVLDRLDPDRVVMLDLLCPKLGDATLERAGRFPNLTLLGLGQARMSLAEAWPTTPAGRFTEQGFAALDRLRKLETVGLHGPDFTDEALAHLRGADDLRVLILHATRVTGKGLGALGPKPGLQTLKLGGTGIGDADLAALANFPNLELLDLRDTAVTDTGLTQLRSFKHLKSLILAGCHVSAAGAQQLKAAQPALAIDLGPKTDLPAKEKPTP